MARRRKKSPAPPTAPAPQPRADGFSNVISDIGTWRDPSYYNHYTPRVLSNEEAKALWEGNSVASKVVELRPKHAFRRGFHLKMEDKILAEKLMTELESIPCGESRGVAAAFKQAGFYENAYGGAAIFPVVNDGADLSTPLRTGGRMRKIEHMLVLEPRELTPASWYRSILEPKVFRPRTYRLNAFSHGGMAKSNLVIHESRLIIFPGIVVARDQQSANYGWGHGRLNRVTESIEQCGITWAGIASLMHRIEQGVLKLEGFEDLLREDEDQTASKALLNIDRLRSLVKMLVIGKNDDFQRHGVPLSGVPEILSQFLFRIAGDAEIPATFLFGMAPAGLNATGESDREWMDDSVEAEQVDHFGPRVEQAVRLHMLCNESAAKGREPDVWSVGWNGLRRLDEKKTAERNLTQAQADQIYFDMGVAPGRVIRRNRFGGDTYSVETTFTAEEIEELEKLELVPDEDEHEHETPSPDLDLDLTPAGGAPDTEAPDEGTTVSEVDRLDALEGPSGWFAVVRGRIAGGPYGSRDAAQLRASELRVSKKGP